MRRMNGGFDVVDDERNDKRDNDDYDEDGLENNGRDGGDRTDDDGDGDGPGGGGGGDPIVRSGERTLTGSYLRSEIPLP